MRKPSKMAVAREIMLQNPLLPLNLVLAEMRRRGIRDTSRNTLYTIRSNLRTEGKELPHLPYPGSGGVMLGSKRAAIMKELHENSRLPTKEIQKRLAKKGVKTDIGDINKIRSKMMRHWFPEINFKPKRVKPIILTKAQEAMIPAFKHVINWALGKKIFPKKNWSLQRRRDFGEFVKGEIPRLIKNYQPSRAALTTYVVNKLDFLTKEFTRKELIEGMNISRKETELLIRIIREEFHDLKDHSEIAAKLHCNKRNVDKLWKAYQTFSRIQGRLGKREEP